jgi:hypothetical protein
MIKNYIKYLDKRVNDYQVTISENVLGQFQVEFKLLTNGDSEHRTFKKYQYRDANYQCVCEYMYSVLGDCISQIVPYVTTTFGTLGSQDSINHKLYDAKEDMRKIQEMFNRNHKEKWYTLSDDEKAKYFNKNIRRLHTRPR